MAYYLQEKMDCPNLVIPSPPPTKEKKWGLSHILKKYLQPFSPKHKNPVLLDALLK
jgi:hypothetical protein